MTCRHKYGDPDCSSSSSSPRAVRAFLLSSGALQKAGLVEAAAELDTAEKTGSQIRTGAEVVTMARFGANIVMQVKPRTSGPEIVCVYRGVSEIDLLRWRHICTDLSADGSDHSYPIALFPPNKDGWSRAVTLAQTEML